MAQKRKDLLKIVLLGDNDVGKDALIQQFVYRQISNVASPKRDTIHKATVPVDEKQISVEFFPVDHPDQLTDALNGSECDGCLAVYDLSSKTSFENLPRLIELFVTHPLINTSRFPLIVVGNKYDLSATTRQVPKTDALEWFKGFTLRSQNTSPEDLYEVSAKTGDHVDTPFHRITRLAYYSDHHPIGASQICVISGCVEPRYNHGYCYRHHSVIDQTLQHNQKLTDATQLVLPILRQLNINLQEKSATKESPYLLSLLGSIRQLILKIDEDKETTFHIVPSTENDIVSPPKSPSNKDRPAPSSDPSRPLQLPALFYRDIFYINHTMSELLALLNPPTKKQIRDIQLFYQQQQQKDPQNHHTQAVSREAFQTQAVFTPPAAIAGPYALRPPDTKELNIASICPPVENHPTVDYILHTTIAKPPVIDIQVAHHQRIIPVGYTAVTRTVGMRKADLNSGNSGKELFLCYLNDQAIPHSYSVYTNGVQSTTLLPGESTRLNSSSFQANGALLTDDATHEPSVYHESSVTKSSRTKHTMLSDHTVKSGSRVHTTAESQRQKQLEKQARQLPSHMKGKTELPIDIFSTLQPITAVNLSSLLPQVREDAPFGYEIISNMPDSTPANLNIGNGNDNALFFALHRAGPGPDYNLYAKDLFGEGGIDLDYIHSTNSYGHQGHSIDSLEGSLSSVDAYGRGTLQNSSTRGALVHTNTNVELIDTIECDDYIHRRTPLTILTEDSRSMVESPPLIGGRSCGAPIIDVGVMLPLKGGETLPVDWHELAVTLHFHNASLNVGTEGTEVKFIFRIDVVPVLEKIYRPFLDLCIHRQHECADAALFYTFTQLCAILTASIYAPSTTVIAETFEVIKQLKFQHCPPPILNAFVHSICDATPFLLSVLLARERGLVLDVLVHIAETVPRLLSQYTILRIFDVFYLYRGTDMVVDEQLQQINLHYSSRLLKAIVTGANKSFSRYKSSRNASSPMALLNPEGDYPHAVDLLTKHYDLDGVAVFLGKKQTADRANRRPSMVIHRNSLAGVELPSTPTTGPATAAVSPGPLASPPPLPDVSPTTSPTASQNDSQSQSHDINDNASQDSTMIASGSSESLTNRRPPPLPSSVGATSTAALSTTGGSAAGSESGGSLQGSSSATRIPPPFSLSTSSPNLQGVATPPPPFQQSHAISLGLPPTAATQAGVSSSSSPPPIYKSQSVGMTGLSPVPPASAVPHIGGGQRGSIGKAPPPPPPKKEAVHYSSVLKRRTQDEIRTIVENINENPYDMCAALVRHLADEVVSSKVTDQDLGRLQRRPFGSQTYGDIACMTDRLLTDNEPRNWLLQPPLGYGINPALRKKYTDEECQNTATPDDTGAPSPTARAGVASAAVPVVPTPTISGLPTTSNTFTFSPSVSSPHSPAPPPLGIPTIDLLSSPRVGGDDSTAAGGASTAASPASTSTSLSTPIGLPTIDILSGDRQLSVEPVPVTPRNETVSTPAGLSALQKTLQQRKEHNLHSATLSQATPVNTPESLAERRRQRFTTYTRVFHGGPDLNPDRTPYKWRYFKLANAVFETERERRRRRKLERQQEKERETENEALILEEHQSELANRRMVIHNTTHQHYAVVSHRNERLMLSLLVYLSKVSNSDTDTNPMHASSIKSLSFVSMAGHASMAEAYRSCSPFSIQIKDEMILRRVYALEMIQYILDRGDSFLKNSSAAIQVISRFVVPAVINNSITTVTSMFYSALRTFVTICEKYNTECQAEIGLFIDSVVLELLLSPACPVDFKVHLFDLLELILNTPSKIINLYHTHDSTGRRNVYEKLIRTIAILILKTNNGQRFVHSTNGGASSSSSSPTAQQQQQQLSRHGQQPVEPNAQIQRFQQQQSLYNASGANNYSTTEKSYQEQLHEKLKKCALRMYVHHLHMLAQWAGVPSLKRSIDATNALKLTCKSYLHVLICSNAFPQTFLTSEAYTQALEVAAKKLQMYFEAFPDRAQERPYVQMPGVLEEFLRVEFDKELKQLLGINSGLTRKGGLRSNLNLTKKSDSLTTLHNNLKLLANHLSTQYRDVGLAAGNVISASHRFLAEGKPQQMQNIKEMRRKSLHHTREPSNPYLGGLISPQQQQQLMQQSQQPQPPTPSHRRSSSYATVQQFVHTTDTIDIDGKSIKTLEEEGYLRFVQSLEEQGDGYCLEIEQVLGKVPSHNELEIGIDLGHYLGMDQATISMVKRNPRFASTLTTTSALAKSRDEALMIFLDATAQGIGKDNLKSMTRYIAKKHRRWLTPMNMAALLYNNHLLDPSAKGDYLSNQDDEFFNTDQFSQLRAAYTNLIDFNGMPFVAALRYFLTSCGFRMPGEGQKVSRMVEAFCNAFCRDNPDDFGNSDVAELVCMATVILNTDLHNPSSVVGQKKGIKPPMSLVEFVENVKRAGSYGRRTDVLLLVGIYIDISTQPIEWISDANDSEDDNVIYQKQQLEQFLQQQRESEQPSTLDPHGLETPTTSPRPSPLNVHVANAMDGGAGMPQAHQTPSTLSPQQLAALNYRNAIRNGTKLRSIRRQALCQVRLVGPTKQINSHTSSTQICASLWSYVWRHYLSGITAKVESSPFFNPVMAAAAMHEGREGIDEVDFETLHLCIDSLAYGGSISIALGHTVARRAFVRVLAKIAYIEQMNHLYRIEQLKTQDTKDKRKDRLEPAIELSNSLRNALLSGEHLKPAWYGNIEQTALNNSVHACKMLLNIAMTTKANISFQRRQQVLRTMQEEFNNEITLVDDTDRAFIRKGNLFKVSSSGKLQDYAFFLFSDLLIYASAETGNKTFKIHQPLHLSLVRIVQQQKPSGSLAGKDEDGSASSSPQQLHPYRFKIVSPQKTIIIAASTQQDLDCWVALIQDCITKQLVRRSEWGARINEAVHCGVLTSQMVPPNTVGDDVAAAKKKEKEKKDKDGAESQPPEVSPDELMEQHRLKNLRRHAIFAASSVSKLTQLVTGIRVGTTYCKLCVRHYKLLRRQTLCQNCLEEVCGDCCSHSHTIIDSVTGKKRNIKVCDACYGLLTGMIGESQPLLMIEETL